MLGSITPHMSHEIPHQCCDKSIDISVCEAVAKPEFPGMTKGFFNLCVYPHTSIGTYNEGASSDKTVQIIKVTLFVTWLHADPTLFHGGGRIICALKEGTKHRSQKVN
ncbi:unnamed protein product [Schistosoma rodhaini]|uniref:Uncharacterized protein n=1 Tax=Schistosoma rodhaini TaxID=6188 RepID=A0AA85F7X0_9TREM|nr:unnamed protein product [Schistosoma rodhaini]